MYIVNLQNNSLQKLLDISSCVNKVSNATTLLFPSFPMQNTFIPVFTNSTFFYVFFSEEQFFFLLIKTAKNF